MGQGCAQLTTVIRLIFFYNGYAYNVNILNEFRKDETTILKGKTSKSICMHLYI